MSDLISRQAAIDALVKAIREDPYYDSNEAINGLGVCDVRVILNDLPSAERRGRWEKVDDNLYEYVAMCSVCRNEVKQPTCMLKPIYSYCPICGAKMDEVKE